MSITSRINEMSSHIEQAYDELQGLGADLTNVDKNIENISMVLDDIYDSMPHVSGEGASLTLEDTRVGKIKSTLKGNTSQDGTPTPSSPIPVNVVSGDNEIEICGKNLNNGIDYKFYISGSGTEFRVSGSDAGLCIKIDGTSSYTISTTTTQTRYRVACSNLLPSTTSQGCYNGVVKDGTNNNITINTNGYEYLLVNATDISTIQIEKGSTASTYEPYQGNTYNIDLPEGMELCKIGNYQDYFYKDSGKWYKYGAINKVILNGTESWVVQSNTTPYVYRLEVNDYLRVENTNICLCNYFKSINNGGWGTLSDTQCTFRYNNNDSYKYFYACTSTQSTVTNFQNWLSSNNVSVYYVLATPTNTEITYQPLIDQLNLLEKAMSKDGQTNISQVNNDLPFIISASALKEWSV